MNPRSSAPDDGAIVLGWLTKVALSLAVVGVLAYDGISLVTTTFATNDRATTLASDGADAVHDLRSVDKAYLSVSTQAAETGDNLEPQDFVVLADGHVKVTLHREATSLWMQHIGPLKRFLRVSATAEGSPAQ